MLYLIIILRLPCRYAITGIGTICMVVVINQYPELQRPIYYSELLPQSTLLYSKCHLNIIISQQLVKDNTHFVRYRHGLAVAAYCQFFFINAESHRLRTVSNSPDTVGESEQRTVSNSPDTEGESEQTFKINSSLFAFCNFILIVK